VYRIQPTDVSELSKLPVLADRLVAAQTGDALLEQIDTWAQIADTATG
jgi:hypothetical protein